MHRVEISGSSGRSLILVGEAFAGLERHLPSSGSVVVTDENVLELYGGALPTLPVLSIAAGEGAKTLETVRGLYERLFELGADRATMIVGVGGGVVCDVAGFLASTYLRGLRLGFVATTLLAQVDASVGGKNGVNLGGYKNLVGTFKQPEFVICDPSFLKTLPPAQVADGMAEIVKHALIADAELFAFIEENTAAALALEPRVVERLVLDSVHIKSSVVGRDERESGERRKLNFGHTFGHGLERAAGLSHGRAVSVGMVAASALSVRKGLLAPTDFDRIVRVLERLKLPTCATADPGRVMDAVCRDKKREAGDIHFVLLEGIGRSTVEKLDAAELAAVFPDLPGTPIRE